MLDTSSSSKQIEEWRMSRTEFYFEDEDGVNGMNFFLQVEACKRVQGRCYHEDQNNEKGTHRILDNKSIQSDLYKQDPITRIANTQKGTHQLLNNESKDWE